MGSFSQMSLEQFRSALTDAEVRTLQTIHSAFIGGVAVFSCVAFYIFSRSGVTENDDTDLIRIMSTIVFFLTLGSYFGSGIIFKKQLATAPADGSPAECVALLRTSLLIRTVILEAPALFGLVNLLNGTFDGSLRSNPEYWLNLVPALIFVGFMIQTFPNRDRLETLFTENFSANVN